MGVVVGIDIAKKKFDVALLMNEKVRHKVFSNSQDEFSELNLWLRKHGVDRAASAWRPRVHTVRSSPHASTVRVTRSASSIPHGSKGSHKVSCSV